MNEHSKVRLELEILRNDHRLIQTQLAVLAPLKDRLPSRREAADLENFIEFVRDHHAYEEAVLFPWLASQPWISQGGPRCVDFMGRFLADGNVAHRLMASGKASFHRPSFLSASSPLEIPLEEHQAGEFLASEILRILRNPPEERDGLASLVRDWMNLVEEHREKEDECLFAAVERALAALESAS